MIPKRLTTVLVLAVLLAPGGASRALEPISSPPAEFVVALEPPSVRPIDEANVTPIDVQVSGDTAPAIVVTIRVPSPFRILAATTTGSFAAREVSPDGSGVQFVGLRSLSLEDTFTLDLVQDEAVPPGSYSFQVTVCDATTFGRCNDRDDTVLLAVDGAPPALTTVTATGEAGVLDLARGVVSLAWTAGADVASWYVGTTPPSDASPWVVTRPTSFALDAPDGARLVHFAVRDAAGNYAAVARSIVRDSTPPAVTLVPAPLAGWFGASPVVDVLAPDSVDTTATLAGASASLPVAIPEGTHVLGYSVRDLAGNPASDTATYRVDLTDPTVEITTPTPTGWHTSAPRITLTASDAHSGPDTVEYRIRDGGATLVDWTALPAAGAAFDLAHDGAALAVDARATDHAGHTGPVATLDGLQVDRQSPVVPTLVVVPDAIHPDDAATFEWTPFVTPGPSGFAAWLVQEEDDGAWTTLATLTSPSPTSHTVSGLDSGASYAWRVVAQNGAGLQTPSASTGPILVDLDAPDVVENVLSALGDNEWLVSDDAAIRLDVDDAVSGIDAAASSYVLTVDGTTMPGNLGAGANTIPLPESGDIVLSWHAEDQAGHVASDFRRYKVDWTPPTTTYTIDGAGADGEFEPGVVITFEASDDVSRVAVTHLLVDGPAAAVTGNEVTLTIPGTYVIDHWSVDHAGNVETVEQLSLRVDALAVAYALDPFVKQLSTLGGTAIVGLAEAEVEATFTHEDGTSRVAVADVTDGAWTVTLGPPLAPGAYHVSVLVRDAAGRSSAPLPDEVIVDPTPPTTSPSVEIPAGWSKEPVSFLLLCDDGPATPTPSGCDETLVDGETWDGAPLRFETTDEHVVTVRSRDHAGNLEDSRPLTIRIDLEPPMLTLGELGGPTNTPPAVGGAIAYGPSGATLRVRLDGVEIPATQAEGAWSATLPADLADGVHDVQAELDSPLYGRIVLGDGFLLDRSAPRTTFPTPLPSGWVGAPFVLDLACDDGLSPPVPSGCAGILVDGGPWDGTPLRFDTTAEHMLTVQSFDAADNFEDAQPLTIRVDLDAPTLTVDALDSPTAVLPTLAGTYSHGPSGGALTVTLDGAPIPSSTGPGGTWSATLPDDLADGPHVVVVTLDPGVQDDVEAVVGFVLDTTTPRLALTASQTALRSDAADVHLAYEDASLPRTLTLHWSHATFDGDVTDAGSVVIAPGDGSFTFPSGDGIYLLRVDGEDEAGNPATSPTLRLAVDRAAPALAQTSATSVLASAGSYTLVLAAHDESALDVALTVTRDDGSVFAADALRLDVPLLDTTRRLSYHARVTDEGANVVTLDGAIRVLDPTAPKAAIALEGTRGTAGWFLGPVTATLSAEPNAAVVHARGYPEGATPPALAPRTSLRLDGTGIHVLDALPVLTRDGVTTEGPAERVLVRIDADVPRARLLSAPGHASEGAAFEVTAEASDVGSGVAAVFAVATLEGRIQQTALAPRADGTWAGLVPGLRPGAASLTIRVLDAAGNSATSEASTIQVADATPPVASIRSPLAGIVGGVVELRADAFDDGRVGSISFFLDGAPMGSAVWDTRASPNGPHVLRAVATDAEGNVGSDEIDVIVDNAPTGSDLSFSPDDDLAPVPATPAVTVSLAVSAHGGRAPTATLHTRVGSTGAFTPLSMTIEDGVAKASIEGPFRLGDVHEAFVVLADGASTTRVPATGVATLSVKVPPDAALAEWADLAHARPDPGQDIPEDYADIVDSAVLVGPVWTTFAARMEGPIDLTGHARYFVDLSTGHSFRLSYSAHYAEWYVDVVHGETIGPLDASLRTLAVSEHEFRLRVRTSHLASLAEGGSDLRIAFRTVGSGDATGQVSLDILAPVIGTPDVLAARAGSPVRIGASATDASAVTLRALATRADGALVEAPFVAGVADLGAFPPGPLGVTLVAVDAAGNRAQRSLVVDVADVTAPIAHVAALGSLAGLAEGQTASFTGEASTDDVGITRFEWDFDGDGRADATGRRAAHAFTQGGDRVVTLTVRDAAGNLGRATLTVPVADVTPPALRLVAPDSSLVVRAGVSDLLVDAPDATSLSVRVDGAGWTAAVRRADGLWTHAWSATEGVHTIDLRALDAAGNLATLPAPVSVIADAVPPALRIASAALAASAGERIAFVVQMEDAVGIAGVTWTFGDGIARTCDAACPSVVHAYDATGTYDVRVRVVDHAGFATEGTISVTIRARAFDAPALPSVSIAGPSSARAGETVEFAGVGDGIAAWYWGFSDGGSATGRVARHVFATAGEHRVTLLVQTPDGRSNAASRIVTVSAPLPPPPPAPEPEPEPEAEVPVEPPVVIEEEPAQPPPEPAPTPADPPTTRVTAPTGLVASPARVRFDAPADAVVYWRVLGPGNGGWRTLRDATIAGDGVLTVEFYAVSPAGREPTRSLTLELDGLAPEIGKAVVRTQEGGFTLTLPVGDAHTTSVEARVRSVATQEVRVLPLARGTDGYTLAIDSLEDGVYAVEVAASDAVGHSSVVSLPDRIVVGESPLESSGDVNAAAARETPGLPLAALLAASLVAALAARRRRPL